MTSKPKVAVFSPNPMVSIAIESFSSEGGDDIHIHPAGQGVWVARMAAELGADPVLCGFVGGEVGTVLRPLLEEMAIDLRLVETAQASGTYIHDRRSASRSPRAPPSPPRATRSTNSSRSR
jgi:1-phosphofructokinase